MRFPDPVMTVQPVPGDRRPPLWPDAVRRPRRRLATSGALVVLAAALAGQALAVLTGGDPTMDILLAQLPALGVVAVGCCSLGRSFRVPLGALVELGSRAEHAERALAREHDRVHELRATLAAVSVSHRLLHDPRTQLAPHRKRRLQRVHDAELDRLERLLADQPEPEGAVDLDVVIAPLVDASVVLGAPVVWRGGGGWVHGRPDGIAEALHVLLDNAWKHAGGREVEIAVTRRGRVIDISVTDCGPGIAPEVLPRIFEREVRGPHSPGAGLGLSIAQRRAEEMGGHLRLVPLPPGETGACFVLTLLAHAGDPECLAASD